METRLVELEAKLLGIIDIENLNFRCSNIVKMNLYSINEHNFNFKTNNLTKCSLNHNLSSQIRNHYFERQLGSPLKGITQELSH